MSEIYFSTDVETDGPIPGPHSMLSLGSAAFTASGKLLSTFSANLAPLPGAAPEPSTEAWWQSQPKAIYEAARTDPQPPAEVMAAFSTWVKGHHGKPVFVGYPATFDFLFVYYYLIYFLGPGSSPFSFSALDIKSYAMAKLGTEFRETTKRNMPRQWFPAAKHTHVAVDDAVEQGHLFCNILKWSA